ncbi:pyrroline-5-carboxylate reductase [Alicyclobacillus curvatus]|jgi:pyrroline-5-carboxylate reductase|nr:pyrroline-5-carboxylate reductase [Alicyclobacillus curvatus]
MLPLEEEIFVIGAGAMAEAFVKGLTSRKAIHAQRLMIVNRSRSDRIDNLCQTYGVQAATWEQVEGARLVVVAVKPANVGEVLEQIRPMLHGQPVLSFAAGVSIDWMSSVIQGASPVIRTMPNIPVAVLEGATAVSFGPGTSWTDKELVRYLLGQLGEVVEIPESLMNSATAFSGSGPGFVCYFLEAMEDAAVRLGFEPEIARELLLQTVVGTARTLREWGLSPHELRRRVTSPGGTTHAGVTVMEESHLRGIVDKALGAAADRSAEMGDSYK